MARIRKWNTWLWVISMEKVNKIILRIFPVYHRLWIKRNRRHPAKPSCRHIQATVLYHQVWRSWSESARSCLVHLDQWQPLWLLRLYRCSSLESLCLLLFSVQEQSVRLRHDRKVAEIFWMLCPPCFPDNLNEQQKSVYYHFLYKTTALNKKILI